MDAGSLLFYRADGVLIVRPLDGESHVASESERAEANAGMLAACAVTCEDC
jgi:hypothetical protein